MLKQEPIRQPAGGKSPRMEDVFETLAPDYIRPLKPYQPGKPVEELERELGIRDIIKIASNENPMGPSPLAVAAAQQALLSGNFYPDGYCFELRRALAEGLDVDPSQLVFGAGSNELVYLLVQTFCRPGVDEVLSHKYAFISYKLAALSHNVRFVEAEVTPELSCDVDALIAAITPRTRIIFLANPNNPTGSHVTRAQFERLLAALPPTTILAVDEAYYEYAIASDADYARSQDYAKDYPLLISLRTFSKIYGLAGLRVGYGIGHPKLVNYIDRVRRPFNVNAIGQVAGRAALGDVEHVKRSSAAARSGIPALSQAVAAIGLTPYPSLCNFVLVDVKREAGPVYDALLRAGVIVRPMGPWGLPNHVRISIGTPEQTQRVVDTLARVL